MPTEDIHQRNTKHSKVVRVTVVDDEDNLRVFHLTDAKVVLRYIDPNSPFGNATYHPSNIASSGKFASSVDAYLELAVITDNMIELEVLDEDRS